MNADDPETAHQMVADYLRVLEQDDARAFPASVHILPYPKQILKPAILTCVRALRESRQLTSEMGEFLEQAYVALADYVEDDLVRVMTEYRDSLAAIAAIPAAQGRQQTAEWRRIQETSHISGEIASCIADEAAALRAEFRLHRGLVQR